MRKSGASIEVSRLPSGGGVENGENMWRAHANLPKPAFGSVPPAQRPHQKEEQSYESMQYDTSILNRRVRVFWQQEGTWFVGAVAEFNPVDDTHCIHYEDGDIVRHYLNDPRTRWEFEDKPSKPPLGPSALHDEPDARALQRIVPLPEEANGNWQLARAAAHAAGPQAAQRREAALRQAKAEGLELQTSANSSGYLGVSFQPHKTADKTNPFMARHSKQIIGWFATAEEGALQYARYMRGKVATASVVTQLQVVSNKDCMLGGASVHLSLLTTTSTSADASKRSRGQSSSSVPAERSDEDSDRVYPRVSAAVTTSNGRVQLHLLVKSVRSASSPRKRPRNSRTALLAEVHKLKDGLPPAISPRNASQRGRVKVSRFIDESEQPQQLQAGSKRRRQHDDDDDDDEPSTWVQCERCNKWRRIMDTQTLPEYWTCTLNLDPLRNTCAAAEEDWDEEETYDQKRYSGGRRSHYLETEDLWADAAIQIGPRHQARLPLLHLPSYQTPVLGEPMHRPNQDLPPVAFAQKLNAANPSMPFAFARVAPFASGTALSGFGAASSAAIASQLWSAMAAKQPSPAQREGTLASASSIEHAAPVCRCGCPAKWIRGRWFCHLDPGCGFEHFVPPVSSTPICNCGLRARWQHVSQQFVCGSGQPRSLGGCGFCAAAGRDPELPTRIEMKQIEIEHARNLAATLTMVAYGCEHIFIDPSDMPPLAKPSARPLRA